MSDGRKNTESDFVLAHSLIACVNLEKERIMRRTIESFRFRASDIDGALLLIIRV